MGAISNSIRRRDGRLQQTQVVERNSLFYTKIISFWFVLVIPQSSSTKMERLPTSAQQCELQGTLKIKTARSSGSIASRTRLHENTRPTKQ
jgi:hypothetical protein